MLRCRSTLPRIVQTSLAVWVHGNPLSRLADRASTLSPFTRDAMMFGGLHGLFDLRGITITPNRDWRKRIAADLKDSTDEVRTCSKRAEFVGRWLANAGSPSTVMAILGVRP
jgi:hypothetical protein